jgi:hypothetical protein
VISPLSNISVCLNVTKYRPKSVPNGLFRVIDISCNKTTLFNGIEIAHRGIGSCDAIIWPPTQQTEQIVS